MTEIKENTFMLLHKYNRLWVVISFMSAAVVVCVTAIVLNKYELILGSISLALMCAWEISDVIEFKKYAALKEDLDNASDKLVLAEHKAERLTLELEATQAALSEAKRLAQIGQVDEAGAETSEVKPKPKRPAFKRKPRPKQTENENKD